MPKLDGIRLAIKAAEDPLAAAADIVHSLGLSEGESVWVRGTLGQIGTVAVLFISQVSRITAALAESLGGDPLPFPADVKCKQCGYMNILPFVDVHHLPGCQNPAPPPHSLKVF